VERHRSRHVDGPPAQVEHRDVGAAVGEHEQRPLERRPDGVGATEDAVDPAVLEQRRQPLAAGGQDVYRPVEALVEQLEHV
jgi:hypothetical protein